MNAAALRLQDIAANDGEVSGFGNEVLIMADEQSRHQDVAEAINSVGVEGMGVVSTMQSMPMVCWQTWRMINLADGGWIRVIPMDVECSRYLVDACGPRVQATEAAGLQAVLAEDLAQHLQWTISRIESTKAQMSLQAREAAVEVMGLAGFDGVESWAVEATVAMSAPPTITARASRYILVTASRLPGQPTLDVQVRMGLTAWRVRVDQPADLRNLIGMLRQGAESRLELNRTLMGSTASRSVVAELLRAAAGLGSEAEIAPLAVGPVLVDIVCDLGARADAGPRARISSLSAPRGQGGRFSPVAIPARGVHIAGDCAEEPSSYQVVALVDGQPMGFTVPLASLAPALKLGGR